MQNLEIDDDAIGRSEEENDTIPLTTTTTTRNRLRRNFPSLPLGSSFSPPLRSRTTRERQFCAMFMVILGMLVSTSVVLNIARNYHPPWYYSQGPFTGGTDNPLSDLLKNRPRNATTNVDNVTTVVQNDTQSTGNDSKVLP
jgi:hypothetical protein